MGKILGVLLRGVWPRLIAYLRVVFTYEVCECLVVNSSVLGAYKHLVILLFQVPNRFRFPFYPQIHWYAAKRYTELLEKDLEEKNKNPQTKDQGPSETEFLENKENFGGAKNDAKKRKSKVKIENGSADNGAVSSKSSGEEASIDGDDKEASPKEAHWEPIMMTDFEVDGVKRLIERLRTWDRAINNCPAEIPDQEALLDRLEVI